MLPLHAIGNRYTIDKHRPQEIGIQWDRLALQKSPSHTGCVGHQWVNVPLSQDIAHLDTVHGIKTPSTGGGPGIWHLYWTPENPTISLAVLQRISTEMDGNIRFIQSIIQWMNQAYPTSSLILFEKNYTWVCLCLKTDRICDWLIVCCGRRHECNHPTCRVLEPTFL